MASQLKAEVAAAESKNFHVRRACGAIASGEEAAETTGGRAAFFLFFFSWLWGKGKKQWAPRAPGARNQGENHAVPSSVSPCRFLENIVRSQLPFRANCPPAEAADAAIPFQLCIIGSAFLLLPGPISDTQNFHFSISQEPLFWPALSFFSYWL